MNSQVKKKINKIKAAIGYVSMQSGPRCDACNYAEAIHGRNIRATWHCKYGEFETVATSRCNMFEPVKVGKP